MKIDYVILVDEKDQAIGQEEKLAAHQKGLLHRAFSILLFNEKKEVLLQQRALSKYHSAGLWTNTCCSHPAPNESTKEAANRRLQEELLMTVDQLPELHHLGAFKYKTEFDNKLTEHEYDHVLLGFYNSTPKINQEEAIAYEWKTLAEIQKAMKEDAHSFTFWFQEIISHFCTEIEQYIDESLQKRNL